MAPNNEQPRNRSRRPSQSNFKQQRLAAWQPILTARTVFPWLFFIGLAFIPIGIILLHISSTVQETIIDYTNCHQVKYYTDEFSPINFVLTNKTCANVLIEKINADCKCRIEFELKTDFNGDVYMYYGLTNYYQNHRRYVKSRDDKQLLGQLSEKPSLECVPFEKNGTNVPIVPCGAIANSLFNDTLALFSVSPYEEVPLLKTGIAWPSDKNIKFRNPHGNITEAFKPFAKPVNWNKYIYELDMEDENNNGFQNEDFIVWMKTAALPTFRKLYRRVNHTGIFSKGLSKGKYLLLVDYRYDVVTFDGTKRMILSTTSFLGGKNPFLGIAYIVVGVFCGVLGFVLLAIHVKCGGSEIERFHLDRRVSYY